MMPQQFGDAPLTGTSWRQMGLQPIAARYIHTPDENDVRLLGADRTVSRLLDPEDVRWRDYAAQMSSIGEMVGRGETLQRGSLLRAWLERGYRSGMVGYPAIAPRGIQATGDILGNVTGALGRQVARPFSGLGDSEFARYIGAVTKIGPMSIFRSQGSEEARELTRGAVAEFLVGSTQLGQLMRVMQFPGIYRRSGLNLVNFGAISMVTGAPFMAGWRMGQRAMGRFVAPYSHAAQFANEKSADVIRSDMRTALNAGESFEEIAKRIMESKVHAPAVIAVMRDRGDLNEVVRRLHESKSSVVYRIGAVFR